MRGSLFRLRPRGMARRIRFLWCRACLTFEFVIKVRSAATFTRSDRGRFLVLCLLRSGEKDGFVSGAEVKSAFLIEVQRGFVRFVDEQADGFRVFEELSQQG